MSFINPLFQQLMFPPSLWYSGYWYCWISDWSWEQQPQCNTR